MRSKILVNYVSAAKGMLHVPGLSVADSERVWGRWCSNPAWVRIGAKVWFDQGVCNNLWNKLIGIKLMKKIYIRIASMIACLLKSCVIVLLYMYLANICMLYACMFEIKNKYILNQQHFKVILVTKHPLKLILKAIGTIQDHMLLGTQAVGLDMLVNYLKIKKNDLITCTKGLYL